MPRALILMAAPLLMASSYVHSGQVAPRTGPEMSDFALFGVAALGVWVARRALRARFAKRTQPTQEQAGD